MKKQRGQKSPSMNPLPGNGSKPVSCPKEAPPLLDQIVIGIATLPGLLKNLGETIGLWWKGSQPKPPKASNFMSNQSAESSDEANTPDAQPNPSLLSPETPPALELPPPESREESHIEELQITGATSPDASTKNISPPPPDIEGGNETVTSRVRAVDGESGDAPDFGAPQIPVKAALIETTAPDVPKRYLSLIDNVRFFDCRIFALEGSSDHGYQDFADANPATGFAAIADGTSQGGRSEIVSQGAVRGFIDTSCDLDDEESRSAWWKKTREEWYRVWRAEFNTASDMEQTRWDKGGSTTFLSVQIGNDGTYRLYTVGDCALHWFDAGLNQILQIDGATTFNSHPLVLHTGDDDVSKKLLAKRVEGKIPASVALLATDALAQFLQEYKPWEGDADFGRRLRKGTADEIREWLLSHKAGNRLDSDDYTFILLSFSGFIRDPDLSLSSHDSVY